MTLTYCGTECAENSMTTLFLLASSGNSFLRVFLMLSAKVLTSFGCVGQRSTKLHSIRLGDPLCHGKWRHQLKGRKTARGGNKGQEDEEEKGPLFINFMRHSSDLTPRVDMAAATSKAIRA